MVSSFYIDMPAVHDKKQNKKQKKQDKAGNVARTILLACAKRTGPGPDRVVQNDA
jgi:hypothetical protein